MATKKRGFKRSLKEDGLLVEMHRVGMLENPHDVVHDHGDGSRTIESEDGKRRFHVKASKKRKKKPRERT